MQIFLREEHKKIQQYACEHNLWIEDEAAVDSDKASLDSAREKWITAKTRLEVLTSVMDAADCNCTLQCREWTKKQCFLAANALVRAYNTYSAIRYNLHYDDYCNTKQIVKCAENQLKRDREDLNCLREDASKGNKKQRN